MLHTHLYLHVSLTGNTTGPSLGGNFERKQSFFSDVDGRTVPSQCLSARNVTVGTWGPSITVRGGTQVITADCSETAGDVFQRIAAFGLTRHVVRLWEA